jgi:hypothetical protein
MGMSTFSFHIQTLHTNDNTYREVGSTRKWVQVISETYAMYDLNLQYCTLNNMKNKFFSFSRCVPAINKFNSNTSELAEHKRIVRKTRVFQFWCAYLFPFSFVLFSSELYNTGFRRRRTWGYTLIKNKIKKERLYCHVIDYRRGFGMVIGFIELLQNITTNDYSATLIHTLCSSLQHVRSLLSWL